MGPADPPYPLRMVEFTDAAIEVAGLCLFGPQCSLRIAKHLEAGTGSCDLVGAARALCAATFPEGAPVDMPLRCVELIAGDRCAVLAPDDVPNHRLCSRWIPPVLSFSVAAVMQAALDLSCMAVDAPHAVGWEVSESRGQYGALVRYDFPNGVFALARYGDRLGAGVVASITFEHAAIASFALRVADLSINAERIADEGWDAIASAAMAEDAATDAAAAASLSDPDTDGDPGRMLH